MRLKHIDSAKGLGMLLILWGHIVTFPDPISLWGSGFKITLFYFITGYLLSQRAENGICRKTPIKKLLLSSGVPYAFYSLLSIIAAFVMTVYEGSSPALLGEKLLQTVTLSGVSTMWFLPSIFFGRLIFERLYSRKISLPVRLIFIIALPAILCLGAEKLSALSANPLVWRGFAMILGVAEKSLTALWFICIGFEAAKLTKKPENKNTLSGGISLLSLVAGSVLTFFNKGVDFNNTNLGTTPALFFVTGVLCSVGVIGLFRLICEKLPCYLTQFAGKNSLFIMVTHLPLYIVPAVSLIFEKLVVGEGAAFNYLRSAIIFVAVLVIEKLLLIIKDYLTGHTEKHIKSEKIKSVLRYI